MPGSAARASGCPAQQHHLGGEKAGEDVGVLARGRGRTQPSIGGAAMMTNSAYVDCSSTRLIFRPPGGTPTTALPSSPVPHHKSPAKFQAPCVLIPTRFRPEARAHKSRERVNLGRLRVFGSTPRRGSSAGRCGRCSPTSCACRSRCTTCAQSPVPTPRRNRLVSARTSQGGSRSGLA